MLFGQFDELVAQPHVGQSAFAQGFQVGAGERFATIALAAQQGFSFDDSFALGQGFLGE